MAEEKKFLDETMEQPKNRKLVAKNVVLAFVVFVILLLCVLAWFSSRSDASASGLSVKTSGESGLEVSLDGGKHWGTSWSSKQGVNGSIFSPALAKYDSTDAKNGGSLMQLLSGNGQDLYYTKSVDADGNVEDKDFVKISDDKAGDYCLEFEAYFRSENQCSVALTDQSKVEPFNLTDNMWTQSTPSFSANYIAGAARVAFLQEDVNDPLKLTKTGLWIPNPLYQLTTTASEIVKYEKMPDNYGGSVSTSTGGSVTGDFPPDYSGPKYYLWTSNVPMETGNVNQAAVLAGITSENRYPMLNLGDGKYYCQFYTVAPTGQVEQVFTISTNPSKWKNDFKEFNGAMYDPFLYTTLSDVSVDNRYSFVENKEKISWGLTTKDYGLTDPTDGKSYRFSRFNYSKSTGESSQLIRVVLDTKNYTITLMDPDNSQVSISKPEGTGMLNKYEEIVVTKDDTSGMSSTLEKAKFDSSAKSSECDLAVAEVAEDSTNEGVYKYKFGFFKVNEPKLNINGPFLAVDSDGNLTTVSDLDSASYFHVIFSDKPTVDSEGNTIHEKLLAYISTDSQGNKNIRYVTLSSDGTKFELSPNSNYGDGYMIYQKIGTNFINYGMRTDNTKPEGVQEDKYYYFDDKTKTKAALDPKEYKTSPSDCKKLVELKTTKEIDGKTYYVGKMKVRIFAEGFDREAKKPMEKGKIKVNLQFIATTIS